MPGCCWLALSVQVGDDVRHLTEWFGTPVELDLVLHDPEDLLAALREAGLEVAERYLRGPLPGSETGTDRLSVLARQPQSR